MFHMDEDKNLQFFTRLEARFVLLRTHPTPTTEKHSNMAIPQDKPPAKRTRIGHFPNLR